VYVIQYYVYNICLYCLIWIFLLASLFAKYFGAVYVVRNADVFAVV